MTPSEPATPEIPRTVWRVASTGRGESFSRISAAAADTPGGNRFDVPGGGTLYACTDPLGCYYETLSRFRVTMPGRANSAAKAAALDSDLMLPGHIPRGWRDTRSKYEILLEDPLPFVDVEDETTRAFLTSEIPETLDRCGAPELDISDIRGRNRGLTRAIARWVYLQTNDQGEFAYSGIRYQSRHDSSECWAIFDGTPLRTIRQEPIELDDPDLERASNLWGLRIH